MSLRDRLERKRRPERTITLDAVVEGADRDTVTVRALAPADWDLLVDEHPPTDEQAARGQQWNDATFLPALLAECVDSPADQGAPLTAEDWAELLIHSLAPGQRIRLCNAAVEVNDGTLWMDPELGKG